MSATQPPADAVEAVAETIWEAEFRRATGKQRLVPWAEINPDDRERYRFLARAVIATLRPAIIAEERAATVAWLRTKEIWWAAEVERYQRAGNPGPYLGSPSYGSMAASIERGDHEQKGPSRG